MKWAGFLVAAVCVPAALLVWFPRPKASQATLAAPDLETAAVARGLVRDPADRDIVGLYARETDRVCIVRRGDAYRIGAFEDYNDGITCTGAGTARRSGDKLDVTLGEGCRFEAKFEGDRIVFPGRVPDACQKLCNGRASFAALNVVRFSESQSEAAAMRVSNGKLPCSGNG